ncbi:apolipoprotein L1 isoform X2 [Gasterosteus aculeatus]
MQKAALFGGLFKKSADPLPRAQDSLSLSSELSQSSDSLTDGGTKQKSGVFGGLLKRSKAGHVRRPSQDLLDSEFTASNDSLSENAATKEKKGVFGGMFKKSKPFGARPQSQEDVSASRELSASKDDLSVKSNTKEPGGLFNGVFKKPPKPFGARTQSQEDLSALSEASGSNDNLSANSNTKGPGGVFGGMFKKSPKPFGARTQSQEGLSEPRELSGSRDSLSENAAEKGGFFGDVFKKKGAKSQSQDDLSEDGELSASSVALTEKSSQGGAAAKILRNPFTSTSREKNSECEPEVPDGGETPLSQKQSKFSEAMEKMNPFRSANKHEKPTGADDKERDADKQLEGNVIRREAKDRSETPPLPRRPAGEVCEQLDPTARRVVRAPLTCDSRPQETKTMSTHAGATAGDAVENQSQTEDEGLKEEDEGKLPETKSTTVRKQKHHNPFMPHAGAKPQSDDEGLEEKEAPSSKEDKKAEEGQDKTEAKIKKPKRHNPFMPRAKGRVVRRNAQDAAAENDGGNRCLFDRLEDFRVDPSQAEDRQDVENLMEWWNQVDSWEDTPQDDDMTEKEEAKAFAVTAEKVQKGIRVFNKLFSERAESLWQHVIDLNGIADGLDKFNKNTKIAQITGGSTSAIGGVATITGLALAPVTMGISLIVTAVGLGVATAGGLTSAGAGISNQVNNSMDRKKVEKIVQDYQEKMVDLDKCLKFIKRGIENLKRFDLIKMKKHAYNRDFPALSSSFYEDGAMAGKAILINANEIMRVVQIANVAGSTAARAVQIASMATGVLTGLFVGMDIYFVAKDSKELKKGAKSEFAAKIREVATQLHEGLVELNGIREELQATSPEGRAAEAPAALDGGGGKETEDKGDESSEDEIDRIKKAIKKDYENREYV